MAMIDFPRMMTIKDASAASGLAAYRIRQLCKSGTVRSVTCGRKTLVNASSLVQWMQGNIEPQQPGIRRVDL